MAPNDDYGRTEPTPVNVLPDMTFDLSEGQPLPSGPGKTEVPVALLPELAFDLRPTDPVPSLRIDVSLRAGATPGQVALDLFRLYAALNQLELSQHGAGLVPDDAGGSTAGGTVRVTFRPADPSGAAERLASVTRAVGDAARYPSIERCEVTVVPTAA